MSVLNLLLVAVGVSADAFAVALTQGVRARARLRRTALAVAAVFGVFQALMPLIGWAVGAQLSGFIAPFDHWLAFGLLALIGGRMLWEAVRHQHEPVRRGRVRLRELLALGVATSIDALAVGLSFAFLHVAIVPAVLVIGVTTAVVSYGGVLLGRRAGERFQTPAEIVGGLVLIGIGVKILLEHLLA
ncbi:MAG: manganese efflux pump MntP family protein [Microbacterium sp.]|uniref:manganese efflux pump MntP n=1 Tax=Microbacterium sp. TaxID=51671 RepID=UPI0039E3FD30